MRNKRRKENEYKNQLHFISNIISFSHTLLPTVVREARQGLPFTLSPEYMAAQRAYMRYHNMNPIFGISSKEARAADEAH